MGIMDLSHKYGTLEELIFQVDITEIGRGFIEAQEEKHNVFFFFFFSLLQESYIYTNSTVYINNFKENFIIISYKPVLWLALNALT